MGARRARPHYRLATVVLALLHLSITSHASQCGGTADELDRILAKVAIDDTVIVAFSNTGYLDFLDNWLESVERTSQRKNVLVIALDRGTRDAMVEKGVHVYYNTSQEDSAKKSVDFDTPGFKSLVLSKPVYTRAILERGCHVLLNDIDLVWLRDPFPYFQQGVDFSIQTDAPYGTEYANFKYCANTGFFYMRATKNSLELMGIVVHLLEKDPGLMDQNAFNSALNYWWQPPRDPLKLTFFNDMLFPNGFIYFIRRAPQQSKIEPVIVHNNWLTGVAGKRYRFREELMWTQDPSTYFRSPGLPKRKFLIYDHGANILPGLDAERDALISAFGIAQVLNRTLIVPKFYCSYRGQPDCLLDTVLEVSTIDRYFSFRENSFLRNPRTPRKVVDAVKLPSVEITVRKSDPISFNLTSGPIHYNSEDLQQGLLSTLQFPPPGGLNLDYRDVVVNGDGRVVSGAPQDRVSIQDGAFRPSNAFCGAMDDELRSWFDVEPYHSRRVLSFSGMSGRFCGFQNATLQTSWLRKVDKAFGTYSTTATRIADSMASSMGNFVCAHYNVHRGLTSREYGLWLKTHIPKGSQVYIATNAASDTELRGFTQAFFADVFSKVLHKFTAFEQLFWDLANDNGNAQIMVAIEQIICAKATRFIGDVTSSFSRHICYRRLKRGGECELK